MPISRSRIGAVLGSLLMIATACAPAAPPSGGSSAPGQPAKPQAEQKLTIGQAAITPQMHPYISICCTQRRYDVFDMILGQKDDGSIEPSIATAWKNVDPKTWEFTIRTDVKFHDGTPMTADDVVFSVKRGADPQFKYAITSRLEIIEDALKVDDKTVRIVTKVPDGILLKRAAMISILPKAYLEKIGDADFGNKPIGTGPFKLVEFVADNRIVVQANMEHPFRKPTGVSQVTIKNVPDISARIAGLKTGELDIADTIPVDQADSLKAAGFNIIVRDSGGSGSYWVDTVVGRTPKNTPTADKRVRQALNYAIDKEAIAKTIYKGYTKPEAGQVVQPETFGYNPNIKAYPYDVAKAKALLAEAGYPNGFKVQMASQQTSAEINTMNLFIQDQLKAVGIELEIVPIGEYAVYRDYFYGVRQRTDIFAVGSLINTPALDADFALIWFCTCQSDPGRWHFINPEYDQAYLASQTEVNEDRRKALLQKAIEVMHNDPPVIFTVQTTILTAVSSKVKGAVRRAADNEQRYERLSIS